MYSDEEEDGGEDLHVNLAIHEFSFSCKGPVYILFVDTSSFLVLRPREPYVVKGQAMAVVGSTQKSTQVPYFLSFDMSVENVCCLQAQQDMSQIRSMVRTKVSLYVARGTVEI